MRFVLRRQFNRLHWHSEMKPAFGLLQVPRSRPRRGHSQPHLRLRAREGEAEVGSNEVAHSHETTTELSVEGHVAVRHVLRIYSGGVEHSGTPWVQAYR